MRGGAWPSHGRQTVPDQRRRECLEDWIGEDNPVRVIDVFVDELDPSVLLKLYIYGYLNRVQSSRRLEREAGRNVEMMWLTDRLAPDHMTIADFRTHHSVANGG